MPKKEINGIILVTQQEIANEFGITTSAIRKYEDKGLIKPTETTQQGTLEYKWYDEKTVFRIRLIRMYVEMGEKLDQVKQILTNPEFDSVTEITKLRKGLMKEKAKINRQIAFCDLVEIYGIKIATMMTVNDTSAESFMGKVIKRWKKSGAFNKLRNMEATAAWTELDKLNNIVLQINDLNHLAYSDQEVQRLVMDLMDQWVLLEQGNKDFSGNHKLGYRFFYLLSALMISVGNGLFTRPWKRKVGETGIRFMSYAILYGMKQTIIDLLLPFHNEYVTLSTEEEKNEFIDRMYARLTNWLATTPFDNQIPEDDMKEILKELMEDSDDMDNDEEGCDEIYEMIMDELRQLD